ncbi:MAG: dual specificity protein phosphatase family protein [Verrucomicrobiota bacterium]
MNKRVGSFYFAGFFLLGAAGWAFYPLGLIFLWPAVSLGVIGSGYWGLGAGVYGKQGGSHSWAFRAFHCFAIQGHEVSRRYYARQCDLLNELAPRLWIGRQLTSRETEGLIEKGVTAILDLTAEFSEPSPLRRLNYLNLPILDLTAPSDEQIEKAIRFIDEERSKGMVYVHCKIGYSRTAAIAGCYLLHKGLAKGADEAMNFMREARPGLVIRPEAEATLRRWKEGT